MSRSSEFTSDLKMTFTAPALGAESSPPAAGGARPAETQSPTPLDEVDAANAATGVVATPVAAAGAGLPDGVNAESALQLLSPPQVKALEALLRGFCVTDTADHAGVNRATIYRWLEQDELFRAVLEHF